MSVDDDHQPGCVWSATVSESAGGGEIVVMVLGLSTDLPWRYMCLTLLNSTQLDTCRVGETREWPLASEPWRRLL